MAGVPRLKTAHTVHTDDGWELLLYRDRPRSSFGAAPVLLVHGLASTADCWYGGRDGGVATALAESGRDVWSLELRGGPRCRHATNPTGVRMSDKLRHDLPAAIRYILEQTGARALDAVGHSMGGVLLTLHCLTTSSPVVRRLVTIGSSPDAAKRSAPRSSGRSATMRLTSAASCSREQPSSSSSSSSTSRKRPGASSRASSSAATCLQRPSCPAPQVQLAQRMPSAPSRTRTS
jgi:pimeloyl-ACP methyl ester carboxylesterase